MRRAVTCIQCGASYGGEHEYGYCPSCEVAAYSRADISDTLTIYTSHETTGSWSTTAWTDADELLIGGARDTEPDPSLRGVGRTSLMLMDAAERKSVGLPVRIVVALDREIGHMMSNPVLEDSGMRWDDFLTLGAASQGRLRGHERSSVFVDHHVWEVGAPSYLDMLRLELQYLR